MGNSNFEESHDDEITESTETIGTIDVSGKFEIVLDVKKINTNKSVYSQ